MSIQPYVHVETFEEYKERFKDFAHLERTEDGILTCRLMWKEGPVMWSYQSQHAYGELWTAIGHDKKNTDQGLKFILLKKIGKAVTSPERSRLF